ncbi:predicted protein, partial [Nematostella vectensis]
IGVYVRMAALMGFTWVLGFMAEYLWSPLWYVLRVTWYVFVSLNSLQGVHMAAAFALSSQARKLYREAMGLGVPRNKGRV